jgi:hypothetical protein
MRFLVGQHVHISKDKIKFAKGGEQNYTTDVFRTMKVFRRTPRPVYELEDLNHKVIDSQSFNEELSPVQIIKRTIFKIDKNSEYKGQTWHSRVPRTLEKLWS